jgi:hypothetical protein
LLKWHLFDLTYSIAGDFEMLNNTRSRTKHIADKQKQMVLGIQQIRHQHQRKEDGQDQSPRPGSSRNNLEGECTRFIGQSGEN